MNTKLSEEQVEKLWELLASYVEMGTGYASITDFFDVGSPALRAWARNAIGRPSDEEIDAFIEIFKEKS